MFSCTHSIGLRQLSTISNFSIEAAELTLTIFHTDSPGVWGTKLSKSVWRIYGLLTDEQPEQKIRARLFKASLA